MTPAAPPPTLAIFHRPIVTGGASQSNNWSGYNQGILERGGTQFKSIDGTWTVPTATVRFDHSLTNGGPAALGASEQIQLVDANGARLATPSVPDSDADGFNVCTFASSCAAAASS